MENDSLRRFSSRMITDQNLASPSRIQRHLMSGGMERSIDIESLADSLLAKLPNEVLAIFETSNGKWKRNKITKFKESLKHLSREFKQEDFLKIDGSCIDKNGEIDEINFKKILKV